MCFLYAEKVYGGEEDEVLWPLRPEKKTAWKRLRQGNMEGKRRRGRPAKTWFQDLKDSTKLDIADASQLATDWERWREIVSHRRTESTTWLERDR